MDLLQKHADLSGLYLAGGGALGVLQALRTFRERGSPTPVTVCHDLTPVTRQALQEGIVQAVLSHPLPEMAQATIELLAHALREQSASPGIMPLDAEASTRTQRLVQRWIALQVDTPESI
jgi:LacI family transcriptional regulator